LPLSLDPTLQLAERFSRQQRIGGWSQPRLAASRVLVIGAGALGNEALKNLALLGVGTLGIVDFDRVEESNLSRCAAFRPADIGRPKALAAAEHLQALRPEIAIHPFICDLQHDVGAGLFSGYDLVLGCVDNIAARWKLNRLARRAGVPWIDAGIDAFCGQIARFDPCDGPCYECGMTDSMWERMFRRNSCLLPEGDAAEPPIATTILLASLTAALQVQEAIATLMEAEQPQVWPRLQPGERLSLRVTPYDLVLLKTQRREDCMAHDLTEGPVLSAALDPAVATVEDLLGFCAGERVELDWELASGLECSCGIDEIALPAWRLSPQLLDCPACRAQRRPHWVHAIARDDRLARYTLAALGVPPNAHLKVYRKGRQFLWCCLTEA
jgi:molybdopterin/thiamine biosynthesis adenylyltransferase